MTLKLNGLVAAAVTPMHPDGRVNLAPIDRLVDHLLLGGVGGLYVCGSTGEGVSLTTAERQEVAAAFVRAAARRVPVIVQVGHNSVGEARTLAAHARQIGASAVSACAPSYFRIESADTLVACVADIAAGASDLPFYYYHIPMLTGTRVGMIEFLERAAPKVPNLAGLKYTAPTLDEYQACLEWDNGRFEMLWGMDEMLLPALAVGCRAAVGSTYNIASPLYLDLWRAFDAGRIEAARQCQSRAIRLIRTLARYPFLAALKQVLDQRGLEAGTCRPPLSTLTPAETLRLAEELGHLA